MPKQMPVGTIRDWERGQVIKAGENNIFHSGWIGLETNEALQKIAAEADSLASQILYMKNPINGQIFLDREINTFTNEKGDRPYKAEQFKAYQGFYGAGAYSFRNEFSKRFMSDKIDLHEKIQEALLRENEAEGGENEGPNKKIVLSSQKIAEIKKDIKADYKYEGSNTHFQDAKQLLDIVKRTYAQLKQGTAFPEGSKEALLYKKAQDLAQSFPESYQRIGVKRKQKEDIETEINDVFKDNWAIRQTLKTLLDDKYGEYVRKYSKQISNDEAQDQEATFGVKLDDDFETFYSKLFKKTQEDKQGKINAENIDLNKYIGQQLIIDGRTKILRKDKNGHFYAVGAYDEAETKNIDDYIKEFPEYAAKALLEGDELNTVKQKLAQIEEIKQTFAAHLGKELQLYDEDEESLKGILQQETKGDHNRVGQYYILSENEQGQKEKQWLDINRLQENSFAMQAYRALKPNKYPFRELIYLRFETLYGKQLDGDWTLSMLPVIYNLEKIINTLPEGHFRTNKNVMKVINKGEGHHGYAFYSPDAKEINFSNKAATAFSIMGDLRGLAEFNAVAAHEIGHAVSTKFGRSDNLQYKKFAVLCGWDYQQLKIRGNEDATGNDQKIPRTGQHSTSHLITDYAETSPEEAFAEYYSFYFNNRHAIDKWLETANSEYLNGKSMLVCKKTSSKDQVAVSSVTGNLAVNPMLQEAIAQQPLKPEDKIKIDLVNPWHVEYTQEQELLMHENKAVGLQVARNKNIRPIVVVHDKLNKYTCITHSWINEGCKRTRKFVPAIIIENDLYSHLKDSSFSDKEIAHYCVVQVENEKLPVQDSQPIFKTGLEYRNDIITKEEIENSRERLQQMHDIFNSQSLAKALRSLFSFENVTIKVPPGMVLVDDQGEEFDLIKAQEQIVLSQYEESTAKVEEIKNQLDLCS